MKTFKQFIREQHNPRSTKQIITEALGPNEKELFAQLSNKNTGQGYWFASRPSQVMGNAYAQKISRMTKAISREIHDRSYEIVTTFFYAQKSQKQNVLSPICVVTIQNYNAPAGVSQVKMRTGEGPSSYGIIRAAIVTPQTYTAPTVKFIKDESAILAMAIAANKAIANDPKSQYFGD